MMKLNLKSMSRIQMNHHKVVTIDTESSGFNTDDEDIKNAADDCEHPECHRLKCKFEEALRTEAKEMRNKKDWKNHSHINLSSANLMTGASDGTESMLYLEGQL